MVEPHGMRPGRRLLRQAERGQTLGAHYFDTDFTDWADFWGQTLGRAGRFHRRDTESAEKEKE